MIHYLNFLGKFEPKKIFGVNMIFNIQQRLLGPIAPMPKLVWTKLDISFISYKMILVTWFLWLCGFGSVG